MADGVGVVLTPLVEEVVAELDTIEHHHDRAKRDVAFRISRMYHNLTEADRIALRAIATRYGVGSALAGDKLQPDQSHLLCNMLGGPPVTTEAFASIAPPPPWFDESYPAGWDEQSQAYVVGDVGSPLIVLKPHKTSLSIPNFFSRPAPGQISELIGKATKEGRTLPGLAMEFIKNFALWSGCTRVDLSDGWVGYNGDDSADLRESASAAEALLHRSNKLNPRYAGRAPPESTLTVHDRAFLSRTKETGYYGPWGFVHDPQRSDPDDKTVLTKDMVVLRGSFVDLCK